MTNDLQPKGIHDIGRRASYCSQRYPIVISITIQVSTGRHLRRCIKCRDCLALNYKIMIINELDVEGNGHCVTYENTKGRTTQIFLRTVLGQHSNYVSP